MKRAFKWFADEIPKTLADWLTFGNFILYNYARMFSKRQTIIIQSNYVLYISCATSKKTWTVTSFVKKNEV